MYRFAVTTALICAVFVSIATRAQESALVSPYETLQGQGPAGTSELHGGVEGAVQSESPTTSVGEGIKKKASGPARIVNTNSVKRAGGPSFSKPVSTSTELNEFQKFVREATGITLPIYGAAFFSSPHMAPILGGPVPSDYPLGPGDEVMIRGWGSVDIEYAAVIDRNGLINIPRVATIALAGVKAGDVEKVIRAAIGKNYRDFELNVTLGQLRAISIYVVGQANRPGTFTVSSLSTLVTALFQTGGPNANGSMRRVQVNRGGKQIAEMDLYAFLARGDKSSDVRLLEGDVIVIPPKGGQVALTGAVEKPAIYELRAESDDLRGLLDVAGGLSVLANPHKAHIERLDPKKSQPRTVEDLALNESGLSKKLKDGDLVTVLPISPEFANAVTLRGSMLPSGRVPYREGMRITDLIPSKEFLVTKSTIRKQNSAVLERNLVGSIGSIYTDINWSYAVVERIKKEDSEPSLIPFDLGKALVDPKGPDNIQLLPADTVTVFTVDDIQVPISKRHVYVSVEGEVKAPGVYQVGAGDSLVNVILNAGGVTADAYLFGTGFYRQSVRKSQQENLDRLLRRIEGQSISESSRIAANELDQSVALAQQTKLAESRQKFLQRLREVKPTGRISLGVAPTDSNVAALPTVRLENGDRIVIPNRPDFVEVAGAVNIEASLLWQPGKTVSDYLSNAGAGPDSDKDAMFVMRVDGSVISNAGRWMSSVAGAEVYPGDIIVIPEKTDKETFWTAFTRYAKDYTQIFYNLGLGAAAIHTLSK